MMKAILLAGLVTVSVAMVQVAEAKSKRPVVCTAFVETTMPIEGEPRKVAVCTDRAKPVILTTYQVVSVKDEDGNATKEVIGWR